MCLILDSSWIPILARANLREQLGDDSNVFVSGKNTDFGSSWYPDQGLQLLLNMIILSFRPIINVSFEWIALEAKRFYKRNCLYRNHSNNYEDNIKFLELQAGPEYNFHNKSASLNVILFTTLIFGAAFPILYLVALFALIIQYVTERFTLAMLYRLPPKFTIDFTILNLVILSFAPIVSQALNFWMFGNR